MTGEVIVFRQNPRAVAVALPVHPPNAAGPSEPQRRVFVFLVICICFSIQYISVARKILVFRQHPRAAAVAPPVRPPNATGPLEPQKRVFVSFSFDLFFNSNHDFLLGDAATANISLAVN